MRRGLLTLLAIVLSVSLSACGFEIVDTGHRGIETTYGKVNHKLGSLPEGFYWYNPITSDINEMDVRVKKFSGKTTTYTEDVQAAKIVYVVNYHLEKDKAHIMWEETGKNYASLLIPQAVEGALKSAIGKWDAVVLVSNREKARLEAEQTLQAALGPKHIIVTRLELQDVAYQPEFEDSVEKKVIAIQAAEESVNKTVRIKEEAKQKVIAAEGEAKAIKVRADAIAKNPALIQYEAVLKWNGQLPRFTGNGPIPFVDVAKK